MVKSISFVGAGSMAESIISGMLGSGFLTKEQIAVTNKSNQMRLERIRNRYQVITTTDKRKIMEFADIAIIATKPYDVEGAIESVKAYIKPNQLVISVVAGISTKYISELLETNNPVVRAMPNTSASIGQSATAITAGKYAKQEHLEIADSVFQTIGMTTIVDEADMHAVTGISGSGPAYIYYLVEAMEKAAQDAGLDLDVAKALIAQTVIGAGEMLQSSGEPSHILRKNITSPGGTTQAALETLDGFDFQQAVMKCVESARKRSVELGRKTVKAK